MNNAPLLLAVAQTNLPIILSTGTSTLGEIEEALGVLAFGYSRTGHKPSKKGFLRPGKTVGKKCFRESSYIIALYKPVSCSYC